MGHQAVALLNLRDLGVVQVHVIGHHLDACVQGFLGQVFKSLWLAVVDDQAIHLACDGLFDQLALGAGVIAGLGQPQVDLEGLALLLGPRLEGLQPVACAETAHHGDLDAALVKGGRGSGDLRAGGKGRADSQHAHKLFEDGFEHGILRQGAMK